MAGSIGDGGGTGNIGDLEPGYGATVTSLHRATTSTPGSMMTTATKRMSINNTLQQRG